MINITG